MTLAKSRVALVATMLATACGGPLGCALKTHPVLLPQAPSDEVRARLNTIAVPTSSWNGLPTAAGWFRETVDRGTETLAADVVQLVFQPTD